MRRGHNSRFDWWLLYAIPNGPWIVIPLAGFLVSSRAIVDLELKLH